MNIVSKIKEIEKRLTRLEEQTQPGIQAIFLFKRDENGVESYKLGRGDDVVWVDRQTIDEYISHYKKDGVVIFIPECLGQEEQS